jgi:hypothetical protein
MLVILNCVETVHRKWFSYQLATTLNEFVVDGYTVNFKKLPFEVTNSTGTVVYSTGNEPDSGVLTLVHSDEGIATLNKIIELEQSLRNDSVKHHFANVFTNKLSEAHSYEQGLEGNFCYPVGYSDLISGYFARTYENYIITGSFSLDIIEQIKTDLGSNNVTIINIIRNPSTCFLAHPKTDDHYEQNPNYSKEYHDDRVWKSLISAAQLVGQPGVITYKYEDIMVAGKFNVLGTDIDVPYSNSMFNTWLSLFEHNSLSSVLASISEEKANEYKSWVDSNTAQCQNVKNSFGFSHLPENIFALLGYSPVNYTDLTSA